MPTMGVHAPFRGGRWVAAIAAACCLAQGDHLLAGWASGCFIVLSHPPLNASRIGTLSAATLALAFLFASHGARVTPGWRRLSITAPIPAMLWLHAESWPLDHDLERMAGLSDESRGHAPPLVPFLAFRVWVVTALALAVVLPTAITGLLARACVVILPLGLGLYCRELVLEAPPNRIFDVGLERALAWESTWLLAQSALLALCLFARPRRRHYCAGLFVLSAAPTGIPGRTPFEAVATITNECSFLLVSMAALLSAAKAVDVETLDVAPPWEPDSGDAGPA